MVETIVTQTVVTKNTGWKSPSQIKQVHVAKNTAGRWGDSDSDKKLGNLTRYDNSYVRIYNPNKLTHITKSPQIACWDYQFDIPPVSNTVKNIVIDKVSIRYRRRMTSNNSKQTVKDNIIALKTGAKCKYDGKTKNVADDSKVWPTKDAGFQNYIISNSDDTKTFWNVDVQRSTVMNTNFGCIVSCRGDDLESTIPCIDVVQMKIDYHYTEVTRTNVHANISVGSNFRNNTKTGYYALTDTERKESENITYSPPLKYNVIHGKEGSYLDLVIFYKNKAITSEGEEMIVSDKTPTVKVITNNCLTTDTGRTYTILPFTLTNTAMEYPTDDEIKKAKETGTTIDETKYNFTIQTVRIYANEIGVGEITVKTTNMKRMYEDDNLEDYEQTFYVVVYDELSVPRRSKITGRECKFIENKAEHAWIIYNRGNMYMDNCQYSAPTKYKYAVDSNTPIEEKEAEWTPYDTNNDGLLNSNELKDCVIDVCDTLATTYSYNKTVYTLTDMKKNKKGNTHAWSLLITEKLRAVNNIDIKTRIIEHITIYGKIYNVMYYDIGFEEWTTIPYDETNLPVQLDLSDVTISSSTIYKTEYDTIE